MTVEEAIQNSCNIWIPSDACGADIVKFNGLRTTVYYADMEDRVAVNIVRLVKHRHDTYSSSTIEGYIREFEKTNSASLDARQKDAVKMICNSNLSVLTGGPGTGKTTTIQAATYVLRKLFPGCSILFAAPTGKAAIRIKESTGENAATLHSLLGLGYNQNEAKEFTDDVLFVDECSMMDLPLADALFGATRSGRKIVLVGDVDQLPSVGPGAVLRDIINSGVVPKTMLTKTFRQHDGPLLANIKKVRKADPSFITGDEFDMLPLHDSVCDSDIDSILMTNYIREATNYGIDNVAVLLPYHQSGYGSNRVNRMIQGYVNSRGASFCANGWTFRVGDPVMQQVNRAECANGEIGKVVEVGQNGVSVLYDQRYVVYGQDELNEGELELGYALSITKSQGSEYASVVLCQLNQHQFALNRNSLYTGLSRAKKRCAFITQVEAFQRSLTTSANNRITLLAQKIAAQAAV